MYNENAVVVQPYIINVAVSKAGNTAMFSLNFSHDIKAWEMRTYLVSSACFRHEKDYVRAA